MIYSSKNLQTNIIVLFLRALPSTWFFGSSLARAQHQVLHLLHSHFHGCHVHHPFELISMSRVQIYLVVVTCPHEMVALVYSQPPMHFVQLLEGCPCTSMTRPRTSVELRHKSCLFLPTNNSQWRYRRLLQMPSPEIYSLYDIGSSNFVMHLCLIRILEVFSMECQRNSSHKCNFLEQIGVQQLFSDCFVYSSYGIF